MEVPGAEPGRRTHYQRKRSTWTGAGEARGVRRAASMRSTGRKHPVLRAAGPGADAGQ